MNINFISEIQDLQNEPTQRSALRISSILENNAPFFLKNTGADFYQFIQAEFRELADQKGIDATKIDFREKYDKAYFALAYRLEKIL